MGRLPPDKKTPQNQNDIIELNDFSQIDDGFIEDKLEQKWSSGRRFVRTTLHNPCTTLCTTLPGSTPSKPRPSAESWAEAARTMPATELVAALKPALEQACKASQHTAECDVPSEGDLETH